ncbi:MAG: LexA family protein [Candidatus Kapaibacteriales bacterium]
MKIVTLYKLKELEFFRMEFFDGIGIPFASFSVPAGFPSPADDYIEPKLDLNEYLVHHPAATFLVRVQGDSMVDAGIYDGDILIVDRALDPKDGDIAVCVIDGEFTVKRLRIIKDEIYLSPENNKFKPIKITSFQDFRVWGIVTYIIHRAR